MALRASVVAGYLGSLDRAMIGYACLPGGLLLWIFVALVWVLGVLAWGCSAYYFFRARRFFLPQFATARWFSPVARFRASNFAPEAAPLVVRARVAMLFFVCAWLVGCLVSSAVFFFVRTASCAL